MLHFEVRKGESVLSRHSAKDQAEKDRIVENIRLINGRGCLLPNDGIKAVDALPPVIAIPVVKAPAGYRPPPKRKPEPVLGAGVGQNLGDLLKGIKFN